VDAESGYYEKNNHGCRTVEGIAQRRSQNPEDRSTLMFHENRVGKVAKKNPQRKKKANGRDRRYSLHFNPNRG
jgi:hypothetical protein